MATPFKRQSTKDMEYIKTYKLMELYKGNVYPLFIDSYEQLPMRQWLTSNAPNQEAIAKMTKRYALISMREPTIIMQSDEKPKRPSVGASIYINARWVERAPNGHLYDMGISSNGQVIRFAHRPGWHSSAEPSLPGVNMDNKVWTECYIPADDYYIHRANVSGLTDHHGRLEWYISQKIFISKILDPPI